MSYINTYKKVFKILPKRFKKSFLGLQLLILFTSIVDLLGLAVFIPILAVVVDKDLINKYQLLSGLRGYLGIETSEYFLLLLFCVAFLFFLFRSVFILFSNWVQSKYIFSLSEYIGSKTYQYYLSSSYQDFQAKDSSKIIRELTLSNQHLARFLVMPLLLLTTEFLVIIFVVTGIAFYNIKVFLLIICTIFPVAFLFNLAIKKKMKAYGEQQNSLTPKLYSNSNRGIFGFIDVILRSKESVLYEDYTSILKTLNGINVNTSVLAIAPAKIFELVTVAGLFVIFVYGIFFAEDSKTVLPLLAIYAAAGYRITPSLSKIIPSLAHLQQYSYLFPLYKEILRNPNKIISNSKLPRLVFNDRIGLENIDFAFNQSDTNIFEGLGLEIKKGEIIGFIGKSGSGKTTLVKVIAGFLTPTKGHLLVDGVKIDNTNLRSWMSTISYVQQSPYIEQGSLALNIAFLEEKIDYKRLQSAIKRASLDDFLQGRDPESVQIEENGKNLSGGQKQRVVIARALYCQSQLIIMDEATSALDNETEQEVNKTIQKLKGTGVTILIIAHRHSTLIHADRVLLMQEGRVSETQVDFS
jgi:ABC-type multidrug transport system fused ATPase/permease subunit